MSHSGNRGQTLAEAIPVTMTAMGYDAPGGPDVFRPETMPTPQPGTGQVLIRVAYAGVNRPDVIQRQGFYPPPPGASPIPGLEVSGTVVAIGRGAPPEMLNQQVCALVSGGGYAEYCLADVRHCLHVPGDLPLDQAAALPETLFTVWHNVFERGWAKEGETLLTLEAMKMFAAVASPIASAPWASAPAAATFFCWRSTARTWRPACRPPRWSLSNINRHRNASRQSLLPGWGSIR